jgi:hypothetical protein
LIIVAGLLALWAVATSRWVDRHLSRFIGKALKRCTPIEVRDYASVLKLAGEYSIVELFVERQDWLANKTLRVASLWDEGILVLGIQRKDGTYLGTPCGSTAINPSDSLVVYGRISSLDELDQRRKGWVGNHEHTEAMAERKEIAHNEPPKCFTDGEPD